MMGSVWKSFDLGSVNHKPRSVFHLILIGPYHYQEKGISLSAKMLTYDVLLKEELFM